MAPIRKHVNVSKVVHNQVSSCRYGDTRAVTVFGIICTGEEQTVSQCRTRGGLCQVGLPEFDVAIECGNQIDACK